MNNQKASKNSKGNWPTIKRILHYIKPYGFMVILSILFAFLSVALSLYTPILIGDGVDMIVGKGDVDFDGLKNLTFTIIIVVSITAVAQWIMNVINNNITYRVVKDIRTKAFAHIEKLPLSYIDSHQYGDIISRVVADVDTFADGLLMGFTQLFSGIITILGTLVFMALVNIKITLVVVLVTPLSLVVASIVAKKTFAMFKAQSVAKGKITSHIDEMINNQKVVKAFGHEDESVDAFNRCNEELSKASLKATFVSSTVNPATRFVNGLVYALVGIAGAFAAIKGLLSVGQLTCFLSYANQYTKPFNEISGVVTELQNAIASAARVFELLDETPYLELDVPKPMPVVDGKIDIDYVDFSYVPDKPLITDLDLHVKPGQRVAIVGPTGCGKSTIINLLMRFYDVNSGSIKINDVDIRDLSRHELRAKYGMVLQETWLKSGTIADNIRYGKPEATMDEVIAAAKASHAHGFIMKMPKGYDTLVSDEGGILSAGQKQLLCIARVMIELPPILILDEATSSIDTRTEINIQNAFAKMMRGRTSFIVAHRLSTIKEADTILVMKDGNIIEQGSHKELLEKKGFYETLYNSQFAQTAK